MKTLIPQLWFLGGRRIFLNKTILNIINTIRK